MKWTDDVDQTERRSKFSDVMEAVKLNQHKNPDQWAEVGRYEKRQSAADTARRLRDKYSEYEIISRTDQETREGVVFVRFIGNNE